MVKISKKNAKKYFLGVLRARKPLLLRNFKLRNGDLFSLKSNDTYNDPKYALETLFTGI